MRLWTEIEFERVAATTKISDRTLAACRDILIDGKTGIEAAERHKILTSQISRSLRVLRDRREEIMTPTDKQEYDLKKLLAIRATRELMGNSIEINDPRPGMLYTGPVILNEYGFVVQKIGRSVVIHDLDKLQDVAQFKGDIEIQYPASGTHIAHVKDNALSKNRAGIER